MNGTNSDSKEDLVGDNVKIRLQNGDGISFFHRWITVEPAIMLYFFGQMAMTPITDQYVLHVIQKENNFTEAGGNSSQCIQNYSDPTYITEQDMQAQASNMAIIFSISTLLPSLLITTQLGGYSNVAGRKLAMMCPLVGSILRCAISALIVNFDLPLQFINVACICEGLSGGIATFLMSCFAYVADVTPHKNRSLHIYVLEIAIGVGIVGSSLATGYMIKAIGYMYPFAILCGVNLVNLLYVLLVLRETVDKLPSARFFTMTHQKKLWDLYMHDDGTNRRWKLQLSLLILFCMCLPQIGAGSVLIYFQIDSPICFDSVDLGLWSAARYLIVSVSGVLVIKLGVAKLGDTGIMIISGITAIFYYTFIAFITSRLVMYIASLGSACSTLIIPMVRSFASKIVGPQDQGAMFSAVANAQSLAIPLANIIFNSVYSATLKPPHFKGTTFLVQAGFVVITLVLVVVLIIGMKREQKKAITDLRKYSAQTPHNQIIS